MSDHGPTETQEADKPSAELELPKRNRRRLRIFLFIAPAMILLVGGIAWWLLTTQRQRRIEQAAAKPPAAPAPPELARHRQQFMAGIQALERRDAAEAEQHLGAFSFGSRPVEEYRLYHLSRALKLQGKNDLALKALSRLWRREPRLIYWPEAALELSELYEARGAFGESARVLRHGANRASNPLLASRARSKLIETAFYSGNSALMFLAAKDIVVGSPRTPGVSAAATLMRSMMGLDRSQAIVLSVPDRVVRAETLRRDGAPLIALEEITGIEAAAFPSPWRERIALAKGMALASLRRYEESNRHLEPITSGYFKYAIPAIAQAAKNYERLAASINPVTIKVVTEKQKAGTRKIRNKKKKIVTVPRFKLVRKEIKIVNAQAQARKDGFAKLHVERLKDLLQLPADPAVKKDALRSLINVALAKNQDDYVQTLVPELIALEEFDDTGLQRFWDKGWDAYMRGDLDTARSYFAFVALTYRNPNARRQSEYWLARSMERAGEKVAAQERFQQLANAPYEDLFAKSAQLRGVRRELTAGDNPFAGPDNWPAVASEQIPVELRLAYELNAVGASRDARLEVQRNTSDSNRIWTNAILGELYHQEGAPHLANQFLRRAFPRIATVEQNEVDPHFLRMYYPQKFEDEIRKNSEKRQVDPYVIMALIHQESAYLPTARSSVGATGLMQLMPPTAREIGKRLNPAFSESRLVDPETNIELGTYYLKSLLRETGGSLELALAAYNAGPGNVRKWRRQFGNRPIDEFVEMIPYSETSNYVKRITIMRSTYQRMYERAPSSANP